MIRRPPISTRTDTLLPYTTLFRSLPSEAEQPVITIAVGETIDSMYIGFSSKVLANNQISDYLLRVVAPKLQAVDGVQQAEFLGEKRFALRVWMDPDNLSRSEERSVGKECVSKCRSRWSPYH